MGDVLTQKEIDSLLKSLEGGEVTAEEVLKDQNKKTVKDYNFSRPSKFSREHLHTLEIIFEHYGRLLSTHLPAYLRRNIQIEVVSAEAQIYSEFTNALSNPVLLGIIDFDPLDGNIIIELQENIGYAMVDRMLGGAGLPLEKKREFTEIEKTILERVFTVITNLLHDPWLNVEKIEPRFARLETNSQFAQIISPNETVALISMNIKIGNTEGLMSVCIPYTVIEPVIDKLNTKHWYSSMQDHDFASYKDLMEIAIAKAKVPLRVMLGNSVISVNDFVNMQKGDIIKLDTKTSDELDVFVGNILKFKALPGSSSDAYAVKIAAVVREEEET